MNPLRRPTVAWTTALMLTAIFGFTAIRTYAATGLGKVGVGPADMVLIDNSCTMQLAAPRPGEVKTAEGAKNILVCWRVRAGFNCRLVTTDTKDTAFNREIDFAILDDRAPLVMLLSSAPIIMVSVDWSTGSFVLAQTSIADGSGNKGIVQKMCSGQVMTGEAFAKNPLSGRSR